MRVNTLMYHDVVRGDVEASGFHGAGPALYKLTVESFLEHLTACDRMTDRAPTSVDEVLRGDVPRGSWLLTFDDGGSSAVETAELLARRGWRGHFFVVTDQLGRPGFMRHDDVRAVERDGAHRRFPLVVAPVADVRVLPEPARRGVAVQRRGHI